MVVKSSELHFRPLEGRSSGDPFEGLEPAGLSMRVVHVSSGSERTPHRHPHSAEAIYVVEGRGHLWAGGRTYGVAEGDCLLVPSGVPHATIPDEGKALKLVCFFPHPDLDANLEELDEQIEIEGHEEREERGPRG